MKFAQTTFLLLPLFATGCVTPSASVTDLTQKNMQTAEALADAHEASLASMNQFLAQVESNELAYIKEARTKIGRLTKQALESKLEAIGAEFRSRFDDELWDMRGEEFAAIVQRDFREPFAEALRIDAESVQAERIRAAEYPGDVPMQRAAAQQASAHQVAQAAVAAEEHELDKRAAQLTSDARARFAETLEDSLEPYRQLLDGITEPVDNSFASILSAKEVKRVEKKPLSYKKHKRALQAWSEKSVERLRSHLVALEAADRFLRGKRLSFLFVEGDEAIEPLTLPDVPKVKALGLGDTLVQLRAQEGALEGLVIELETKLQDELNRVRESLEATVRLTRSHLADRLSFLQLPR